ncbi:MAG: EamA-like transporter family protein [Planctomycetaceae bacterium]|nr:EamA-like transporter family protein [Planctomycetaceae bacterium]
MNDSVHLLFPLFSSIVFVFGATFAKQTAVRGTNPYTNTALSNLCLALFWTILGFARGTALPWDALGPAILIAFAFVMGQLCTYLAFQFGDVSLATPIFGVKIIIVAMLSSLLADQGVNFQVWIAAVLAALGIAVIQAGSGASRSTPLTTRRAVLTILLALLAATALSLFDIGLQACGRKYGAERFLTMMFFCMGVWSCGLLPWANGPAQLQRMGVIRPLLCGTVLMAAQAVSMSYALGHFGDATRVNIVYALRGLWSVGLAWLLSQLAVNPEGGHSPRTMVFRLVGAILITVSIFVALT